MSFENNPHDIVPLTDNNNLSNTTHSSGGATQNSGSLTNNLMNCKLLEQPWTLPRTIPSPKAQKTRSSMVSLWSRRMHPIIRILTHIGPVGQSVQNQAALTSNEFSDLANARTTPATPAATGQPLTHYHSLFYRLLSWRNPRATGITFATTVAFIFAARYVHILRYVLKGTYLVLGVTALAEVAGHAVLGEGLTTKVRPRKYFVIPKESLERFLDDAEQLINFFVIEVQRVVFAENIWATLAAFSSAFISYWLIKWLPLWGLTLIGDIFLFLGPLIYIKNQAFIDENLSHAKHVASAQAKQVGDLAAQHTGRATESLKGYTNDYTKKAQDLIGSSKARANGNGNVRSSDLPSPPRSEPFRSEPVGSEPAKFEPFRPEQARFEPVANAQEPHAVPQAL